MVGATAVTKATGEGGGGSLGAGKVAAVTIVAGGGGFDPKKNHLYEKKFSEMYDGLIFIKNITLPTNNLIAK